SSQTKERYAFHNYTRAKYSLLPSLIFFASNSHNSYNQDSKVFGGKFVNSNYIGLKLSWNLPNSNTITSRNDAKYNYLLSKKTTEQSRLNAELESEQLNTGYQKAFSMFNSCREIERLQLESYEKNKNIYLDGLQDLDKTINSFTRFVN